VKKYVVFAIIILFAALCGCSAWMNGNYASATPHKEQNLLPEQTLMAPKTYDDLVQILENMVESGQQRNTISMKEMKENWQDFVDDAVQYVQNDCPIGAYAVSEIKYNAGKNDNEPTLSVEISYRRSIADIDAVLRAESRAQVEEILYGALRAFSVGVTVSIADYTAYDFEQIVQDYALLYPQYLIETPRLFTITYPKYGEERIVELVFTYDTSRATLLQMQEQVSVIFSAAEMYVSGDGLPMEKFAQLYSFLMNRYDYTVQSTITPAYSLLHNGVGDSKAFAAVYGAMCRQAGLDCETISGTRSGQVWYWNALRVDGKVYYVDLLRCQEAGKFFYKTAKEMTEYEWDYSAD